MVVDVNLIILKLPFIFVFVFERFFIVGAQTIFVSVFGRFFVFGAQIIFVFVIGRFFIFVVLFIFEGELCFLLVFASGHPVAVGILDEAVVHLYGISLIVVLPLVCYYFAAFVKKLFCKVHN